MRVTFEQSHKQAGLLAVRHRRNHAAGGIFGYRATERGAFRRRMDKIGIDAEELGESFQRRCQRPNSGHGLGLVRHDEVGFDRHQPEQVEEPQVPRKHLGP